MSSTNFVTIKRFEGLTGYTEIATNSKIDNGIWRLGKEWQRAPDGRRIMDIAGYERWVMGENNDNEKSPAKGRGSN